MNIIFMEDNQPQRTTTVMLMKIKANAAGLPSLEIEAPDFYGADEGMEKLIEALAICPPDLIILDNNWSSAATEPDGVNAARMLIKMYLESAGPEDTMPVLACWSANPVKPEEAALFDRVLTQKGQTTATGQSTAIPELLALVRDVYDGSLVSKHLSGVRPTKDLVIVQKRLVS